MSDEALYDRLEQMVYGLVDGSVPPENFRIRLEQLSLEVEETAAALVNQPIPPGYPVGRDLIDVAREGFELFLGSLDRVVEAEGSHQAMAEALIQAKTATVLLDAVMEECVVMASQLQETEVAGQSRPD